MKGKIKSIFEKHGIEYFAVLDYTLLGEINQHLRERLPFSPKRLPAPFLRPGVRPYRTENIYAPFTHRGAVGKEDAIAKSRKSQARLRKGR